MQKKNVLLNYIFFILIFFYFSLKLLLSFEIQSDSKIHLKEGLVSKYLIENKIYKELYPEFLEREHIPQRLFQSLSQEIKKNLFSIFIIIFVDILIILFLISLYYQLTYSLPFRKILLSLILLILFINLYFIERNLVARNFEIYQNYLYFLPIIIDSILIFLSTWLLMDNFYLSQKTSFLDFYFSHSFPFLEKIKQILKISGDLFFISLIGIIIVNLFLLPIYYAQIIFHFPFQYIFLFFIIFLTLFYIYSYYYVSKNREENPKILYSISFLGFKILQNTFQIFITFLFFILIGIGVALLIVWNLNLLENIHILPKNQGL